MVFNQHQKCADHSNWLGYALSPSSTTISGFPRVLLFVALCASAFIKHLSSLLSTSLPLFSQCPYRPSLNAYTGPKIKTFRLYSIIPCTIRKPRDAPFAEQNVCFICSTRSINLIFVLFILSFHTIFNKSIHKSAYNDSHQNWYA